MKKTITNLFAAVGLFISGSALAQPCTNYASGITAVPDSIGNLNYTLIANWQGGVATSYYMSINPGPVFYGQDTVQYTFPSGGTYTVCFTSIDSSFMGPACTYTICDSIVIGGSNSCGSYITASNNGTNNYTFTATPNTPSGWVVNYYWDFGDGNFSSMNPANHTYSANGTYPVNLVTSAYDPNDSSQWCSGTGTIIVTPTSGGGGGMGSCVVSFSTTNNGSNSYTFTNTSFSTDSNAVGTSVWSIDGSVTAYSTDLNYAFADSFGHMVCLMQVYYDPITGDTCYNNFCDSVGGNPGGGGFLCQASFVLWQDSLNTSIYYGYNTSTAGPNATYVWDFGDGTTATGPYPTHLYATTGIYQVCLMVVDSANNCTSTYCDSAGVYKVANPGMSQINILNPSATGTTEVLNNVNASVFPNPLTGSSVLNFEAAAAGKLQVRITDMTGRLILNELWTVNTGKNVYSLNTVDLSSGIYNLSLMQGNKFLKNIKLVK